MASLLFLFLFDEKWVLASWRRVPHVLWFLESTAWTMHVSAQVCMCAHTGRKDKGFNWLIDDADARTSTRASVGSPVVSAVGLQVNRRRRELVRSTARQPTNKRPPRLVPANTGFGAGLCLYIYIIFFFFFFLFFASFA